MRDTHLHILYAGCLNFHCPDGMPFQVRDRGRSAKDGKNLLEDGKTGLIIIPTAGNWVEMNILAQTPNMIQGLIEKRKTAPVISNRMNRYLAKSSSLLLSRVFDGCQINKADHRLFTSLPGIRFATEEMAPALPKAKLVPMSVSRCSA